MAKITTFTKNQIQTIAENFWCEDFVLLFDPKTNEVLAVREDLVWTLIGRRGKYRIVTKFVYEGPGRYSTSQYLIEEHVYCLAYRITRRLKLWIEVENQKESNA